MSNLLEFNPVQCTQDVFDKLTPVEGFLYFITDTKKICLGKNNKMVPMCEGIGLFYGTKEIEYDNSGVAPNPEVLFLLDEVEGDDIPEVNDLILNTDGCFYRIDAVDKQMQELHTKRLTLQGTGGGTGGGSSTGGSFSIAIMGGTAKAYASTATSMPVSFKSYYNGTEENYITQVSFTLKGESEPFYTHAAALEFGKEQTIDLINYKSLFTSKKSVTIAVQDLYGNERSTYFSIELIELLLKKKEENLFYGDNIRNEYTYTCHLSGATSGVTEKKLVYEFYTEANQNNPIHTEERLLSLADEGDIQRKFTGLSSKFNHGIYILRVYAQAQISGSTTVLRSNVLTHKFGYFDHANGSPLLMILTPDKTEQYTNIPMDYLVVTSEANKIYTLEVRLNGNLKTSLNITSNLLDTYTLYFEEKGVYRLNCSVAELGSSFEGILDIVEYTGNLPVIDPTLDELMLYLNPKGKSNSAVDRNAWADYNGKYTATLEGLHYGATDGWHIGADGASYLQLMSGATLKMPAFKPFAYDPTIKNAEATYAGSGMTIELDFELSGVLDYDSEIIKCLSLDKNSVIQTGFVITGDKVKFYNSRLNDSLNDKGESVGALLNLNLIENKRIRLTFVIEPNPKTTTDFPMCYAYLNGVLSGAVIYATNDHYQDSAEGTPATLQVNADKAQVKLYGVRFYSTALSDKMILNNYTASLPTLEERQKRYDTNNVFNASGDVDYALVASDDYNLEIPYMKITGGWATEKEAKWKLKSPSAASVGLPTGKKDYRLIDVEVKYPNNNYFKDYADYKFVNEFAGGKTMDMAHGETPLNGGAIMYAQGTSSLEYPVKNLRLRFKNEENWYKVRPDIAPVEIICMKADYMESSGSHNTGAANFIDDLYTGIGIQTPGQEHFGGEGKDTIVTSIKGHPCLIFYSESGDPGTYKYIGKYNLNLDKATPEPFGFDHDDSDFGYLSVGDPYYKIDYDDEGEYADSFDGEELKYVGEGEKINSIHCFEFLDNAVEVCNFLGKKINADDENSARHNYYDTWYGTYKNADNDMVPGWTLGFESRYPEDRVGYHDADMLWPLASWINNLYLLRKEEEAAGKKPENIIVDYAYDLADTWMSETQYYTFDGSEYQVAYPTQDTFTSNTFYTRRAVSERFEMESLERFKREYECYLNKDFLLTYYLVTEALLMADSRVKNMMIATWGKEKKSYINLAGETVETNNYIFYPIFYDMDTMLGLDNTGVYRFRYYDEDTDTSIYNGDEVLWQFVRDALKAELAPWYTELEGAILKTNIALNYFNANQANMANEAFYNGDAKYKYIRPAREGYTDYLNNKTINAGEAPYLYAAQGDRSLMREWFLSNRLSFLRGKYNSNQYQSYDRVVFRWYYPTGTEADQDLVNSINAVAPTGTFKFSSLKTGYAGIKLGANGNVYNARFNGEETKEIFLPEASAANGTEAYLLGISNLTDLGDLSNKYMQKFVIDSDDVRLETLTLGNPHADYHNPYWAPAEGGSSQAISLRGCSYLKNFNLQNCSAYNNVLDFSNCLAIEKILLTGSSTTDLTLPQNGLLKELRLPTTITSLKIVSHPYLTDFSLGRYNYGPDKKIGGEGGSYINDFSRLKTVWVENTPIDTYEIVRNAGSLDSYYLRDVDWHITEDDTQYCAVAGNPGEAIESGLYEYINQAEGYKLYTGTVYPESGRLYRKVDLLEGTIIRNIPVLDYLLTKGVANSLASHAEALTGTVTLDIPNTSANELAIYQKYSELYPNLKILYGKNVEVEEAPEINFYRYALIDDDRDISKIKIDALEPYYSILADGTTSLADLSYNKDLFTLPAYSATNTLTYTFSGMWLDCKSNQIYYQDNVYSGDIDSNSIYRFVNHIPTADMQLVPIFISQTRFYTVYFYNEDGTKLFEHAAEYEHIIDPDGVSLNPSAYYLYKDESDLGEHDRYTLVGWQSEADARKGVENPKLYDFTSLKITSDLHCYPSFKIEDARTVASPACLFTITNQSISLNSVYKELAAGKLTIPNATNVTTIGDFKLLQANKVYFLNNSPYTNIRGGFGNNGEHWGAKSEALTHVINFPSTITKIGQNAFVYCVNLVALTLPSQLHELEPYAFYGCTKLEITELPAALEIIGTYAFGNCGELNITELPLALRQIGMYAFSNCNKVNIAVLGSAEIQSSLEVGESAFQQTGANVSTLTLNKGVDQMLASRAFNLAYVNVSDVYNYTHYTAEELQNNYGLPSTANYHQILGGA